MTVSDQKSGAVIHKFRLGQKVRFSTGYPDRSVAAGVYEIVRQLPHDGADYTYRIKNAREQHERVVKERDLERA
jgi:hypothetical protein